MRRQLRRSGRAALLGAALCCASARAHAEGPPFTVSQLVVEPSNAQHLALRSTFGLMISQDGGKTWGFRDKLGIGQGRGEPAVAILNGGAIVLGTQNGISTGDPSGCDFVKATGVSGQVTDVIALPQSKGVALAVSADFDHPSSQLWKSEDSGRSFVAVGGVIAHFTATSLGVSAASSDRVYATGLLWTESVHGAFARSDDGGKSFTITPLDGSDSGKQPFVAAVDLARPDRVYVRMTGLPGTLRVSDDAGRSFREILSIPSPIQGFSLAPDGARAFVSSLEAGTYVAARDDLKFERVACAGVPCLTATSDGLLGCGERSRHGFIVGRSLDEGRSFTPVLDTPCLAVPDCAANTSVGAAHGEQWSKLTAQLADTHATCTRDAPTKVMDRSCLDSAATHPRRTASCHCELASVAAASDSRWAQLLGWGLALCFAARRVRR